MWSLLYLFFFFKQKTAYEMRISDWSSDVCSSDLLEVGIGRDRRIDVAGEHRRAVECAGELVDDLARDDLAFLVLALAGLHRVVDQRLDGDHLAGSGRLRDFHAGLGRCHCFLTRWLFGARLAAAAADGYLEIGRA